MKGARAAAALLLGALVALVPVFAVDPPHDTAGGINCLDCHDPHNADGGKLNIAEDNYNVCLSCHASTGLASAYPFTASDQALPGTSGTSHRFDSGPSGHVVPNGANTSTGVVKSTGTFSGRIEREYTITITTGGNVGTAKFSWTDTASGSGTGTTGTSVALSSGISAKFENGTSPSFVVGDKWKIYVRTDLRLPDAGVAAERAMAVSLGEGDKVVCSTCHNQHSQEHAPPDASAPLWTGPGTGEGRRYQRVENAANEACLVCHSAREVTSSDDGSHPVTVTIPSSSDFRTPPDLELIDSKVYCTTCHSPHFADSGGTAGGAGDGYLLDKKIGELCVQCHQLADTTSGSHFNATTGALWPGGARGSTFPANPSGYRGYCVNCHWPHGWPDDATPANDYPRLWVERYDIADDGSDPDDAEDLCLTCHDGSPATSDIASEFAKGTNGTNIYHHPVKDSEQSTGRSVECVNCHNPHKATSADKHAGVTGVDIDGNSIGPGSSDDRALVQYELCFKCHGDTYNSSRSYTSNKRLDFRPTDNGAFHPVAQAGRNQSTHLNSALLGGLTTTSTLVCTDCHNNEETADTKGKASGSSSGPKGPHGSTNYPILRANYRQTWTLATGPTSWSSSNFELCFLCHDVSKLVTPKDYSSGARTNFDDYGGKDNLHYVHLIDRISKSRATCKNCHFNIHSNRTASNTYYIIDGTTYTTAGDAGAAGYKSHLINFSPDVSASTYTKPTWRYTSSTRTRTCYLSCHGYSMTGKTYTPRAAGDDGITF